MTAFVEWWKDFAPSDLIAICAIAVLPVISLGSIKWQSTRSRRDALAERRREVHLRFWSLANALLRLVQADHAQLQGPSPVTVAENEGIPPKLDDLRAVVWEIEIVSPDVYEAASNAVTALDLAAADVRQLSTARSASASPSRLPGTGARLKQAIDAADSDMDAARTGMFRLREALRRYEDPDRKLGVRP
jgi:hypothetical protein